MGTGRYKVLKILNNNGIMIGQLDVEKIIVERGVGHRYRVGDSLSDLGEFKKVFAIEEKNNKDTFIELMERVDGEIVEVCEEIISFISEEFHQDLNEKIHISLTDHIAFTILRLKNNDTITNPFVIEIETLYSKEMQIAEKAMKILQERTGIHIPEDEIGFIAMHIHSARNDGKVSNTVKYAFLCSTITEYIEDLLNIEVDRRSINYERFISHIRFAIERIIKGIPIKNEILDSIKNKLNSSYKIAENIGEILKDELYKEVSEDEIGYIALHVERVKNNI
ncbi:PRD domain-containing protein [Oceanirhabdus seepicola]|uniref:PRD domain-containing protein n=1 Tax=Oceanirhabdus seepicola TaxID=2828781 RepID=A0A9J6NVS5_9CLOT|nr:PRD domain-containing protein [Oceanirhabdus seepicola]MCM1988578.1 PRD domain-containing protein [Oceanirhabdus seepicola]